MNPTVNPIALKQITGHHRSLGLKHRLKGLPYERCAELSWVIDFLAPRFSERLHYLDIGTGESPLPTFLYAHSDWDITCLDKCSWVRNQRRFSRMVDKKGTDQFHVLEADLLETALADESFDIITCVSVIEHFEGDSDSAAMRQMARLLRPGGKLILTTLMNEPYFAEFYLDRNVYGDEFRGKPVFYQRHYDLANVSRRLIEPSGLQERQRLYFGDYEFQCFERILQRPWPLRAFYAWNTPSLAKRYLSYRPFPVSRKDMRMNTASGLILVLEKRERDLAN